jgi:ABC-type Fe3+/spermidine/putrescine transport system ATPase subunit
MSTIALAKVSKVFGDLTAVDKVDLDVAAGEVVCLLGLGCGKTTTLHDRRP